MAQQQYAQGPPASSFQNGPAVKMGALKKKCSGFQTWALRYLVLDKANKKLFYYKSMTVILIQTIALVTFI